MNKFVKVLAMLMALMLCVGLTACSSKQGNGDAAVNYSLGLTTDGRFDGITAKDYVTLGQYTGIQYDESAVTVKEEDIQKKIDSIMSSHTYKEEITDREVADGDTINIDYVGKVDGVEFEGGSTNGAGTEVTIGVTSYIDNFLEQLIGHKPGETFDVTVTFPDGYRDSTDADGNALVLSGKQAVFSVTLNSIEEEVLPELTDAWVDENYGTSDDLHSVEALRAFCQQQLYTSNLNTAVMDYLMDNATFSEVPKAVTDYQVTQCLNYYDKMAQYYGYDLDTFVQSMLGYDSADAMLAAMADSIESYAKEALLYQAVAEAMDLAPTQEQIDAYSAYTDTYGANYCTMIAMMDTVTDALTTGAQVK